MKPGEGLIFLFIAIVLLDLVIAQASPFKTNKHAKRRVKEKNGDFKSQIDKLWKEVNALKEMQALQTVCLRGTKIHKKCYLISEGAKHFHEANEDCIAKGGTLAIPRDGDETIALKEYSKKGLPGVTEFWLGVTDMVNEGKFVDVNGMVLNYFNWDRSQPNGESVLKLTLLDMCPRATLLCRTQQIALDPRSVRFLLRLGVDFSNLEGCWDKGHFFTKLGIFQEQLLSILEQHTRQVALQILLGTKFSIEFLKKDLVSDWPKIIVLADGTCGESSAILGINPEYTVESCNAYGANAVMERSDQRQVPTPEIRAHNLYFDLSAYGMDKLATKTEFPKTAFHLKIHGTFRNRCLALACPASDSKIIKFLHHTLNSTIMKSIFQQSFNACKMDIEPRIGEPMLHCIRCSHRLFEIMLSHRRVTTAFLAEDNIVVTVEGEAARMLNFDTGCGVNLGLKGLESMEELIYKVATAVDQQDIFKALAAKIQHSRQMVEDFKQNGLSATMFE